MTKNKTAIKISFWITLFVGISGAYFVWLTWNKLTEILGNTNLVWGITGGIVLLGIITGYLSFDKIIEKFT